MSRKISILLLCCLLGCFWVGCSRVSSADVKTILKAMAENGDQTSVLIQRDNTFTDVITESFSEEYYDFDELKQVIESEISAYNAAHQTAEGADDLIELASIERVEDNVVLALKYRQWEALQEYSADVAFANAQMTIQTVVNGMTLEEAYVDAEGKAVDKVELNSSAIQKGYRKITASGQAMTVYLENPVVCATDNVTIVDEYMVQIPEEACIVVVH